MGLKSIALHARGSRANVLSYSIDVGVCAHREETEKQIPKTRKGFYYSAIYVVNLLGQCEIHKRRKSAYK